MCFWEYNAGMGEGTSLELTEIEDMGREERIKKGLYRTMFCWINNDYKNSLAKGIKKIDKREGLGVVKSFAELNRDFARVLYLLSRIMGEDSDGAKKIENAIFGGHEESILNCLGKDNRSKVERVLFGPLTVLTFVDLLKNSDPSLEKKIKLKKIITKGHEDVVDKIDVLLNVGAVNGEGKEILNLIQLKAGGEGEVSVSRAYRPRNLLGVSKQEIGSMLRKAKKYERQGYDARCFVVIVPGYDEVAVSRVFGTISNTSQGEAVKTSFKNETQNAGFLPKKK